MLLFRPRYGVVHTCTLPRGAMSVSGRTMRVTLGPRRSSSKLDLVLIPEPREVFVCKLPRGKIKIGGRKVQIFVSENRLVRIGRPKAIEIRGYPMHSVIDYDVEMLDEALVASFLGLGL